jgi:hypothetical protein
VPVFLPGFFRCVAFATADHRPNRTTFEPADAKQFRPRNPAKQQVFHFWNNLRQTPCSSGPGGTEDRMQQETLNHLKCGFFPVN